MGLCCRLQLTGGKHGERNRRRSVVPPVQPVPVLRFVQAYRVLRTRSIPARERPDARHADVPGWPDQPLDRRNGIDRRRLPVDSVIVAQHVRSRRGYRPPLLAQRFIPVATTIASTFNAHWILP